MLASVPLSTMLLVPDPLTGTLPAVAAVNVPLAARERDSDGARSRINVGHRQAAELNAVSSFVV